MKSLKKLKESYMEDCLGKEINRIGEKWHGKYLRGDCIEEEWIKHSVYECGVLCNLWEIADKQQWSFEKLSCNDRDLIYESVKTGIWIDGRSIARYGLEKLVCEYVEEKNMDQ